MLKIICSFLAKNVLSDQTYLAKSKLVRNPFNSLCFVLKGIVQQDLIGVKSDVSQYAFIQRWTTDIILSNLKGTGSLNCKKLVSAA